MTTPKRIGGIAQFCQIRDIWQPTIVAVAIHSIFKCR